MFFNESYTLSPTLKALLGCLNLLAYYSYSSYAMAIIAYTYLVASLRRLTKLSPFARGLSLVSLLTSYIRLISYPYVKKKGLIPIEAIIRLLIAVALA